MSWFILFVAGIFEVVWVTSMKYSEGFTKLWPSVITVVALSLSMALLGYSLKGLPLGSAYAVWTGIGAVGAALLGMVLFGEPKSFLRFVFILFIVFGIVGLKYLSE
ncbi:quaternary ammonium compound efflux SMR transporter SugE [Cytophagaceae bacterium ABcell3]|nr:quaternary ammonium compound efflux SMR transporter SugE [Cytophagaceae bacterium ABcell3]